MELRYRRCFLAVAEELHIVGLGMALMNADDARGVWTTAESEHRALGNCWEPQALQSIDVRHRGADEEITSALARSKRRQKPSF